MAVVMIVACTAVGLWIGLWSRELRACSAILLVVLAWLVSPFYMGTMRSTCEKTRTARELYDPKRAYWSFLFGDTLVLPALLAFSALAPAPGWKSTWWWLVSSVLIGLLAAVAFRCLSIHDYTKVGRASLLDSPTKLWHDYVVYPILGTLVVFMLVPAVVSGISAWSGLALNMFVLWLALGIADMARNLDPLFAHPPKGATSFAD